MTAGGLHHVELWVPDLSRTTHSVGWLLDALGYEPYQDWPSGRSWRMGDTYIVVEQSPAMSDHVHDRCRPGLNHLAFHAGGTKDVDRLAGEAVDHGWTPLFPDRHRLAGGHEHYAVDHHDGADGFGP